jgi:hypothetical protein
MSISQETLQLLFSYLSGFWKISVPTVIEEYEDGLWTVAEDGENPDRLIVNHQTREDVVIDLDDL